VAEMATSTGHVLMILRGATLVVLGQSKPENLRGEEASLPLSAGAWHQVRMSVDMVNLPTQVEVEVGGTKTSVGLTHGAGPVDEIQIGATYADEGGAVSYFIDDVAISQ